MISTKNPFPGMNPYLEQEAVWHDFHARFCYVVAEILTAQVRPHFIVRINEHVYIHEMPADTRKLAGRTDVGVASFNPLPGTLSAGGVIAAPLQVDLHVVDIEQLSYVEIRDRASNEVITVLELLSPSNTSYRPRSEMEADPSFKQLIPYVIFTTRSADGGLLVFRYTRGKGQGESRLHSKHSVGIGGHISIDDRITDDAVPYAEGMRRELEEEVLIDCAYSERCVGLINDDETEVGRVHLGVVHLLDVEQPVLQDEDRNPARAGDEVERDRPHTFLLGEGYDVVGRLDDGLVPARDDGVQVKSTRRPDRVDGDVSALRHQRDASGRCDVVPVTPERRPPDNGNEPVAVRAADRHVIPQRVLA
jgi:predicted NUDIX family phosphoesterase